MIAVLYEKSIICNYYCVFQDIVLKLHIENTIVETTNDESRRKINVL